MVRAGSGRVLLIYFRVGSGPGIKNLFGLGYLKSAFGPGRVGSGIEKPSARTSLLSVEI